MFSVFPALCMVSGMCVVNVDPAYLCAFVVWFSFARLIAVPLVVLFFWYLLFVVCLCVDFCLFCCFSRLTLCFRLLCVLYVCCMCVVCVFMVCLRVLLLLSLLLWDGLVLVFVCCLLFCVCVFFVVLLFVYVLSLFVLYVGVVVPVVLVGLIPC